MRISANEIKIGNILDFEGALWVVAKNPEHTKPGKGPAYIQVEMKNIISGTKLNHRFGSTDHVQRAHLEQKEMQFLYSEDKKLVLMDPETFDQMMIDQSILGDKLPFLADGMIITVESYQDKVLGIKLPTTVIVVIEDTAPSIKGSTVTSSYKPAIVTNGIKVMVPPYLANGEKIVVKTEDTTFVERAK